MHVNWRVEFPSFLYNKIPLKDKSKRDKKQQNSCWLVSVVHCTNMEFGKLQEFTWMSTHYVNAFSRIPVIRRKTLKLKNVDTPKSGSLAPSTSSSDINHRSSSSKNRDKGKDRKTKKTKKNGRGQLTRNHILGQNWNLTLCRFVGPSVGRSVRRC